MTPDQWKQLAAFAGVAITGEPSTGIWRNRQGPKGWATERWQPDSDWSDFGPVLVLLLRWKERSYKALDILPACNAFRWELLNGTDRDIMQAGCELGAAIQKAKGESK